MWLGEGLEDRWVLRATTGILGEDLPTCTSEPKRLQNTTVWPSARLVDNYPTRSRTRSGLNRGATKEFSEALHTY